MIVFSEKVQPTFTSSDHNVIIVEDFNEIFFDVFELEINGNKFVAEKVSDHNGSPVVTIPIENDGKKYNVPCILEKGDKFEIYYNKDAQKTYKPVKTSPKTNDTNILELVETKIQEKVPLFEVPDIEKAVDTIKSIKESAASYLERMRLEYLDEQKREIDKYEKKKKSEIKRLNDDYRRNMVSEFYAITETIKDQISEQNNKERDQYNDFINESFNQYCQELDKKVGEDYQSAIKLFESKIETLTNDIFAEKIQNIFESKVGDLEKVLYSKESLFEKEFTGKFTGKFDEYSKKILEKVENKANSFNEHVENLAERYENAIQSLRESNIETNDLITKNTNRALSRIGNVKTVLTNKIDEDLSKLQESNKEVEKDLRAKLSNHKSYIKKYFGDKVSILENKITDINEENRADVIDLIRKSEEKLLNEISKIDRELPTVILKEARGENRDNTEVSLEDIRRELEGNISNKFSKEIVSLKRLIEMTSGGGGGGVVSGGGDGALGSSAYTTVNANSANWSYVAANSGFSYTDFYVTGDIYATGSLSADSIKFNTEAGITPGVGELTWNADEESLDYGVNSDVTLQIGQEQLIHVKADEDIKNGQAVYASGASGTGSGNITVRLYRAGAGDIDELYFIGVATQDINTNEFGFVSTFGKVRGVQVADTRASDDPQALSANNEGWDIGTVLYVSPAEAGKYTQTKPVAPDKDIPVVMIISENGNQRTFFTRYEHGYHLSEIHDVLYNEPLADGDLLTWNNSVSAWENQPETDPVFSSWAQSVSSNYESTYTTVKSNSADWASPSVSFDESTTELTVGTNTVTLSALSGGGLEYWEEDGTTLQPTVAGYNFGSSSNAVGHIVTASGSRWGYQTGTTGSYIQSQSDEIFIGRWNGSPSPYFIFANGGGYLGKLLMNTNSAGVRFGPTGTFLIRDDDTTLAQRNGTAAQEFRIYNTYTDASNYERGFLKWDTNEFVIGTEALGTGTARNFLVKIQNQTYLNLLSNGSIHIGLNSVAWASNYGVSIGANSRTGRFGVAIGYYASDNASYQGVAIGAYAETAGYDSSTAIGYRAKTTETQSTAMGTYAIAQNAGEFAIGATRGTTARRGFVTQEIRNVSNGDPVDFASTTYISIANNRCYTFSGLVIAGKSDQTKTTSWRISGLVKNVAGTTSLISSEVTELGTDHGSNWSVRPYADDTNNQLRVELTSESGVWANLSLHFIELGFVSLTN